VNYHSAPWEREFHFSHLGKKQISGFGLPPIAVTKTKLKINKTNSVAVSAASELADFTNPL